MWAINEWIQTQLYEDSLLYSLVFSVIPYMRTYTWCTFTRTYESMRMYVYFVNIRPYLKTRLYIYPHSYGHGRLNIRKIRNVCICPLPFTVWVFVSYSMFLWMYAYTKMFLSHMIRGTVTDKSTPCALGFDICLYIIHYATHRSHKDIDVTVNLFPSLISEDYSFASK